MHHIQNWFDQIMGIAQIEQQQRDRAREIFRTSAASLAGLETPACWRRCGRVSPRMSSRLSPQLSPPLSPPLSRLAR
jgi:hypothetical protein